MRTCELCNNRATVYCSADRAFVCWDCDAKVHGANFIVARHARLVLCDNCSGPGVIWSGRCLEKRRYVCTNCSFTDSGEFVSSSLGSAFSSTSTLEDEEDDSDEEVSSTKHSLPHSFTARSRSPDSVLQPNRELRKRLENIKGLQIQVQLYGMAEERLQSILRRWSRSLGLANADDQIVPRTIQLLRRVSWLLRSKKLNERLDARAALATCFWAAIKLETPTAAVPSRFQSCTGVPVQVLVSLEAKLRAALLSSSSSSSSSSSLSTSDPNHNH